MLLLVMGRGTKVALIGCALGLALAGVGARPLASLLYYDISP